MNVKTTEQAKNFLAIDKSHKFPYPNLIIISE